MNASGAPGEAVSRAVQNHLSSVVRFAYSYMKNMADAEDVSQEVFLTYLRAAPAFSSERAERAWLLTVTANRCKNLLRGGWFKRRAPLPDDLTAVEPEEGEVLSAVLSLDEKYRVPIHMYYYEGYSVSEIAEFLRAKPATVATWLSRGRELLRAQIGGIEYEESV